MNIHLRKFSEYNKSNGTFTLKNKFTTHVDLNLRIEYYLTSYLKRMELQGKSVTFDDIVVYIIPLLRNGSTPPKQTILNVLEDIGQRTGEDKWILKRKNVELKLNFGD